MFFNLTHFLNFYVNFFIKKSLKNCVKYYTLCGYRCVTCSSEGSPEKYKVTYSKPMFFEEPLQDTPYYLCADCHDVICLIFWVRNVKIVEGAHPVRRKVGKFFFWKPAKNVFSIELNIF